MLLWLPHTAIISVVILIHVDIQDKIEQWLPGLFCISNLPSPCSQKFLRPLLKPLYTVSQFLRPAWWLATGRQLLSTGEMGRNVPRHWLDWETLPTRRTQFTRQFDAVDWSVAIAVYHATSSSIVWEMDVSHRPVGFRIPVHLCKTGLTYFTFFFSICKTVNTSSNG